MSGELTLEELSARTGEPVAALRRWRKLGLIGATGSDAFRAEDVERARLVQLLLRRGISLESIALSAKSGELRWLLDRYLARMFPKGAGRTLTLVEAAETVGMDLNVARSIRQAAGLSDEGEMLDEDDVAALERAKRVLDAGYPLEALLQVARVYADTLGRAAEAGQQAFHTYVHERLAAAGLSPEEVEAARAATAEQTTQTAEASILYFFRKGNARATRDDMALHLAEEAGLIAPPEVPGQVTRAIAFVDLSSFTPLTEAMGDEKAAEVLERFSMLVRECAGRWDGRVVKQIGDAFMLVFPDARSAVACALEIEARAAEEPQFPAARAGVHWGRVLYREADYVGSNVNIAARVAAEAQRHQVLVTAAVRGEAKGLPDVEFVPLGKRRLKGLASELVLFEARPGGREGRLKVVDPVCGMEMGPEEVAARLTLEGVDRCFCSDECLRRYVAAPEKYA